MSRPLQKKFAPDFLERLEVALSEIKLPHLKALAKSSSVHQTTLTNLFLGKDVELRTKQKIQAAIEPIDLSWLLTGEGDKYLEEKAGPEGTDYTALKQAVAEVLATDPRLRLMDQQLVNLTEFHRALEEDEGGGISLREKIETIYELCSEIRERKNTSAGGFLNVRLAGSIEGARDWKELAKMGKLDESQKVVCDLIFDELSKPIELSAEQIKAFCEIYDEKKNGRRREDVLRALHDHLVQTNDKPPASSQ